MTDARKVLRARRRGGFARSANQDRMTRAASAHFAGRARDAKLTPEQRSEYGRALVKKRWDRVKAERAAAQSKSRRAEEQGNSEDPIDDDIVI